HVDVPRLPQHELLATNGDGEPSCRVRERVDAARAIQQARAGTCNARLSLPQLKRDAALGDAERQLLERAAERLDLSARACHRILKVARTIADLAGSDGIGVAHLAEAVSYRSQGRGP